MEIFSRFRTSTGKAVLRKLHAKRVRRKKVFNFKTAQKIGIVFDATNPNHFNAVYGFYKDLLADRKEVFMLGFVDGTEIPEKYLFKKNLYIFTRKDVNWVYKPKNTDAIRFINKEFDILIDLTLEYYFLLDYILTLSLARFKVGRFHDERKCYDMMIYMKDGLTIEYFINQIKHYLERINRPTFAYRSN